MEAREELTDYLDEYEATVLFGFEVRKERLRIVLWWLSLKVEAEKYEHD
jgi:putative exporter of polyketide antibiotics